MVEIFICILFSRMEDRSFFDESLSILLKYLKPSILINLSFFSSSLTNFENLSNEHLNSNSYGIYV